MRRRNMTYLPAEVALPPALAEAIEKARAFVEERGGRVWLTVDTQGPFTTWWSIRSWGRRSESIETTPVLTMSLGEYCCSESLIYRCTDRGDCWMGASHVESMVRFVTEHEPLPVVDRRDPGDIIEDDDRRPNNPSNDQLDVVEVLAVRLRCDAAEGVKHFLDLKRCYPRSWLLVQFEDPAEQAKLKPAWAGEDTRIEPYGEALYTRPGPVREGEDPEPPFEVMLAVEPGASLAERAALISTAPHRPGAPLPVRFETYPYRAAIS